MTSEARGLTLGRSESGLVVWIHVSPRARRPGIGGMHGDALRVAVREAPERGAANAACVRDLARVLGVRRRDVELEASTKSRRKRVRITGDREAIARRLEELARRETPMGQGV